ncbi:MAG: carboxypeptidase regulatory-like domain-containing protein, partial [Candidatus Muiribacteriota bacterium]
MFKSNLYQKALLFIVLTVIVLTGCSGSKNNPVSNLTGEISQKEIAEIISLAPTRNELKDIIITEINGTLPSESPIRRAPGSYFFTLSQASVEVIGNTAEVKYNFIYIENYGSPSEEYYEGIITVSYLKETTPFVTWVKTGVTVELTEITKGTIKGTVINGITEKPMENVVVYAAYGEERTKAVKTDATGQYEITGVLENTYTVNAIYPEFEPNSVKDIVVTANQTTTAATIKMMPGEDNRFVSLEGYVYFDIEETRPVEEAVVLVYTESGELTSLETGITDINGYYKINFIAEGVYAVYASKGLKINDGQAVTVTASNIQNGTDVTVNNIYLLNSNPEIITVNPLNPVSAEINEELTLTVTAQDEDEDLLYFEWKATGGNLGFSINNTVKWTAETAGSYEVTITVTDKKGGKAEHVFEINVQSEPVELYELNLEVNPVNSGNVTGNGSYEENHEQIITAVAEEGYHFVNWTGDIEHIITGTENNPTVTVKMPAENISLTANFAINQYTLTYIAGTGGSLTGTTTQTINHGGNGTAVAAVPNTGYAFVQWSDGLTSNPRTDTNVTSNKTITAEFIIDGTQKFELTVTAGLNGILADNYNGEYLIETNLTIQAIPDAGYRFLNWTGDTDFISSDTSEITTLVMPAQEVNLNANFIIDDGQTFSLTINKNPVSSGNV